MQKAFEKIVEILEGNISNLEHNYQLYEKKNCSNMMLVCESELKAYRGIIEIVNQVAEEYKTATSNDLEIVASLPSLYPMMQDFEVEAIQRVVERANCDSLMEYLIEAKKNCGEDSDCSKCVCGQKEDVCCLQELQISGGNEEVCEWKWEIDECEVYAHNCRYRNDTVKGFAHFDYCPYCGKKIKVV